MVDRALPKLGPTSSVNQLPGLDSGISPRGEALFTLPGTYLWPVPEGVLSVNSVTIGAASASNSFAANNDQWSGAGGGLSWKNNIPVSPGQIIEVIVGKGGIALLAATPDADSDGGFSQFKDSTTCKATGGALTATTSIGGTNVAGDGGGSGGDGFVQLSSNIAASGAGAGGYNDDGGDGRLTGTNGFPGAGGGGGGGADSSGGGGTGLYGETDSGAGGTTGGSTGGKGGSDGETANDTAPSKGGRYGGAPGVIGGTNLVADGSDGAVRVIWGEDRFFPSTNVGRSE